MLHASRKQKCRSLLHIHVSGYFIVDGKEILITYRFPGNALEITWVLFKSGEVILHATFNESDFSQILNIQSESYKTRIMNSTFSVGLHSLQFLVDKEKDEGQLFMFCQSVPKQ